ncbi:MAG TPA: hypothetical protein VI299_29200 [Polyangiales bacterium]
MQAAGKRVLWAGLGLLALSVLCASAMMFVLRTQSGNRWLCRLVTSRIGSSLAGRIEIDQIEDLTLHTLVARGVRFIPPDGGPPAIDAPRVALEFSPWDFVHGQYGWSRAEIDEPVVRVTEGKQGKTNMEALFASPSSSADEARGDKEDAGSRIELKSMVTKRAKLFIGGSLPKLYLSELDGIMRIVIEADGQATLRFDEYKGKLDGLPTGALAFHDVKGQVWTRGKHLLRFEGAGRSQGEPVDFDLTIATQPSDVHIGARFSEPSAASLRTRMVAAWSKFSPRIDLDVRQQRR